MNTQTIKKKIIIRGLALIICASAVSLIHAQAPAKAKPVAAGSIHLTVYRQSMAIGDVQMGINAVHYLIASDPAKYGNWNDTLALLYLQGNAFQQAYILSNALITNVGYTDMRMEIKGLSAKALQQPTEAIDAYSILYSKTKNPAFGFEQLQLQYGLRRLAETIATGNSLLQTIVADKTAKVNVGKLDGKTAQQVTMKAAIENIMGLAYVDMKDKANATAQFEAALKESPDFELAKKNLDAAKAIADAAQVEKK